MSRRLASIFDVRGSPDRPLLAAERSEAVRIGLDGHRVAYFGEHLLLDRTLGSPVERRSSKHSVGLGPSVLIGPDACVHPETREVTSP